MTGLFLYTAKKNDGPSSWSLQQAFCVTNWVATVLRTTVKIEDGHRITDYKVNRPIKLAIARILFWSIGTIQRSSNKYNEDAQPIWT